MCISYKFKAGIMEQSSKKELDFFKLFDKYTSACKRGSRLQKNGRKIKHESLQNYFYLRNQLTLFCKKEQFLLRIKTLKRANKREFKYEQNYWKKFYKKFTSYLYDEQDLYDNYVGMLMKLLRTYFNYLNNELGLNVGSFHKNFYVPAEEIQIVVLSPERLNFLIYNKEFEKKLPERLKIVKDIFAFGCAVSLRVSDLMNLKETNLEKINLRTYLNVLSKKTQTFTRIKLPEFAIGIIERYQGRNKFLFPRIHNVYLNKYIKEITEFAGWIEPFVKTRQRRGLPIEVFKDVKAKTHYRFCDMITSHCMRRTAITNMLSLGVNEQMARKISGHSSNSKEFFRYVTYSQTYLDNEMDRMFEKLNEKRLEIVEI